MDEERVEAPTEQVKGSIMPRPSVWVDGVRVIDKQPLKISDYPYYMGNLPDKVVKESESFKVVEQGDMVRIKNDAKSLATFICTVGLKRDVHIYTPEGNKVLKTFGIWVDKCCDRGLMEELRKELTPMQEEIAKKWGFPDIP